MKKSLKPQDLDSVAGKASLCHTWSLTGKPGFLLTRLIWSTQAAIKLSYFMRKPVLGFPTRSVTDRNVRTKKMARGLKFGI